MLVLTFLACLGSKSAIKYQSPVYIQTYTEEAASEKACYDKLLLIDMTSKGLCSLEVTAVSADKSSVKTKFVCKSESYKLDVDYHKAKDRVLCSTK